MAHNPQVWQLRLPVVGVGEVDAGDDGRATGATGPAVYGAGMPSAARTAARVLLGAAMVGAGTLHLTIQRKEFQAQVPGWFPIDADLTVLGSGVAEIALGASFIALPEKRRLVGALLAAFFVLIFPGNVAQYLEGTDAFGLDTDRKRLVRLFFQPVLVLWALLGGGWLRRTRHD
ncbi:membrane protein [Blastococcus saxobsidens]|uniref:DoxX family membrane protein n=1 Tax=Blastococcus saxobsidens (strain DD2) TaxID=1146883 RepID=H6RPF0_BLASD|nr:membrane protein [Blastococcus saxobsidens]CCG04009.1 conserved membrane protein of unknown function [Blastococcus saxobsidens DD2]